MLLAFVQFCLTREVSRKLYIDPHHDGDCFTTPCTLKTAVLTTRCADVLYFPDATIKPTTYPSELSDLFIQMSLLNTTAFSKGTIVDGSLFGGPMLLQVTSHELFTWTVLDNFTFKHFSKPIVTRQYTWSPGPFIVFRNCVFEDSSADLFTVHGGTFIFENCLFKNVSGRAIKAVGEVAADFLECVFDNCTALFFSGSDASFTNCRFLKMNGQRGGAIYAVKTTLHVDHCWFIDCTAEVNGGAIYLRESAVEFESEVMNSCFVNTRAKQNGTAIYSYVSHLDLTDNCFPNPESAADVRGSLRISGSSFDERCDACLRQPPAPYIANDYSPVDTNKWYQFDEIRPGTTIVVDGDL